MLYKLSVDMNAGFLFWRHSVTRYWVVNAYWLSHSRVFCQSWEIAGPYFHGKLLPQCDFVREITESEFSASSLPVFEGYETLPLTEVRDANIYGDVV